MSKLNKQIERIESKLHKANASGYKKLSEALNILLKDAIKWAKEFEHNRLSLEDAQSEISCLSLYAIDLTARGEEQCNLERVKGYLTQQ